MYLFAIIKYIKNINNGQVNEYARKERYGTCLQSKTATPIQNDILNNHFSFVFSLGYK